MLSMGSSGRGTIGQCLIPWVVVPGTWLLFGQCAEALLLIFPNIEFGDADSEVRAPAPPMQDSIHIRDLPQAQSNGWADSGTESN